MSQALKDRQFWLRVLIFLILLFASVAGCAPGADDSRPQNQTAAATHTPTATLLPTATATATFTATRLASPTATAFITPPTNGGVALVPILMYHHLADLGNDATPLDHTWTVSPRNFEAQMDWLAAQGFHTVTIPRLTAFLKNGQRLPARPVVITFDDGWAEGYSVAFPTLLKYNFVGTYFVYTNAIDRGSFMTWAELQEMSAAGMEIGSHTLSHPHLRSLTADAAYKEIADSRTLLEKRLGRKVTTFDYPFGEYDSAIIDLVKRAGFESAVTIGPGFKQRADDVFTLHRNRVTYEMTFEEFKKLLP